MKVALISTPSQEYAYPAPSIFFLKGCLNRAELNSTCFDFNHAFMKKFGEKALRWCETGDGYNNDFEQFILDYSKQFLNFDWLCISVFTYNSQNFTRKLLELIRKKTTAKIVIGGTGIVNNLGTDFDGHTQQFGDEMLEKKLVDYVIRGDGDVSLPNLINGMPYTEGQLLNLEELPYPDYSDINFEDYDSRTAIITGSRGCVRDCTFCDVGFFWSKYKYRPGKEVAEEIIHIHKTYGIKNFGFSDSLVNGSLKEFRIFCKILSEANLPISWQGQFIFRTGMTDNDWDYVKKSGCIKLWVGIESASEKVRNDMKKKFSNKVLFESVEQAAKRNINMVYLLIVGYPTETKADFQETLDFINWSAKYKELIEIRINPAMILPNTQLEKIHWYGDIDNWKYVNNDGELTMSERYERWVTGNDLVVFHKFKMYPRHKRQDEILQNRLNKES